MQSLIAGNWKMFKTLVEAGLVHGIRDGLKKMKGGRGQVLICPPFQLPQPSRAERHEHRCSG
jgi:triosephosphate isomerase